MTEHAADHGASQQQDGLGRGEADVEAGLEMELAQSVGRAHVDRVEGVDQGMAAARRKSETCSGALTKRAMMGAARMKTTATSRPSTACILRPARWTAPARASSSAVNLDTDWMVPCTMVLFTVEMALFTTEKAPYSAGLMTRARSTRCKNPATMKKALAKPMKSAPRPASTARSGRLVGSVAFGHGARRLLRPAGMCECFDALDAFAKLRP
jgi:hypothetical protein